VRSLTLTLTLTLIVLLFAGLALAQRHISFPAPDGYLLRADLYGKGPRGVVLAHADASPWRAGTSKPEF